jgi:hypothetical protein
LLVVVWFRPQRAPAPIAVPAPPNVDRVDFIGPILPTPSLGAGWTLRQDDRTPPHPQANRTLRRRLSALERKRRKLDKFVTPQGTPPTPKHSERQVAPPPAEPQAPIEAAPEIPSAELLVADTHFATDEKVLYKESEFYGEYNFRDTILDQLDRYFVYLKRMKKSAPGTYDLYKEVGAIVLPYVAIHPRMAMGKDEREKPKPHTKMPKLSAWFKEHRPGFGCFVYGANPLAERRELEESQTEERKKSGKWIIVPKFMYFNKLDRPPPEVERMSGGDIYSMSILWDRPHDPEYKRKHGGPTEYAVFISKDGETIHILRVCKTKYIDVLAKKHKKRELYFQIPQRCWHIPKTFKDWADDFHEDVEIHLADIFADAMDRYEQAQYSMVRIAAKKDDMVAVFSVNVRRMAYFFQDRDYVLTENGTRKPVFHMVRTHERRTENGTHTVKFHFRGEREFTWAGYDVSITVPGRDHLMLPEIGVGSVDEFWIKKKKRKKYLYPSELGKRLRETIEQGIGGAKH